MGGEFDLKFCNGGDFCMRVREEERVCAAGFFRGGKGERETHIMYRAKDKQLSHVDAWAPQLTNQVSKARYPDGVHVDINRGSKCRDITQVLETRFPGGHCNTPVIKCILEEA